MPDPSAAPSWPFYLKDPVRALHFAMERDCPYSFPESCPREAEVKEILAAHDTWRSHHPQPDVPETTEEEWVAPPKVHIVVDLVIVTDEPDPRVLLIERGDDPFKGAKALPGGYVETGQGEQAPEAAVRELFEETRVRVAPEDLTLLGFYDTPGRDPRGLVNSVAFLARVPAGTQFRAGGDARTAFLWPLDTPSEMAFDHEEILKAARRAVS